MSRMLHLAAAMDPIAAVDDGCHVELARLAERGGLDFVTLDDDSSALAVLTRVAHATSRVGLVPGVTTTGTEPWRVRAAVAALDRVSHGRAGWRIDVPAAAGAAGGAGEAADAAAGLWDDREDDAGARGEPRSPQGRPVRVVDATEEPARRVAARYADVALVRVAGRAQAAAVRDRLREEAAAYGRGRHGPRVLASLLVDLGGGEHAAEPGHGGGGPRQTARGPLYRGGPVDLAELIAAWYTEGAVDGFHLTPVEPRRDLERLVNGTAALLQHRGLFRTFYPGGTLRDHLGLAAPAARHTVAGGAS
ncbi:LLM class flavin-dependent oxidoreductase [Streptomyces sp. NPDC020996]|uniref:LLM class flavin-dependent oxidoreductase n=1 Tax=Streptomyces sp. NPDC020996 TaxID=3154791 RepID=UPI0033D8FB01